MTSAGLTAAFLDLVAGRSGHFRMESGYHSRLWFDLSALFVDTARVKPFVRALADRLRGYDVNAVCGPLTGGAFLAHLLAVDLRLECFYTERRPPAERGGMYQVQYSLPRGQQDRARGKRFAIVDDVISAGSAAGATTRELEAHGGHGVVAGTLMKLGDAAAPFFMERGIPVEAALAMPYDVWLPAACPLCASGTALEDASD